MANGTYIISLFTIWSLIKTETKHRLNCRPIQELENLLYVHVLVWMHYGSDTNAYSMVDCEMKYFY